MRAEKAEAELKKVQAKYAKMFEIDTMDIEKGGPNIKSSMMF